MFYRFIKRFLAIASSFIFSYDALSASGINHYEKAMHLMKNEKYQEAVIEFDKSIKINQEVYSSMMNKGVLLKKLGRYEEALETYNELIEKDSKYIFVYS